MADRKHKILTAVFYLLAMAVIWGAFLVALAGCGPVRPQDSVVPLVTPRPFGYSTGNAVVVAKLSPPDAPAVYLLASANHLFSPFAQTITVHNGNSYPVTPIVNLVAFDLAIAAVPDAGQNYTVATLASGLPAHLQPCILIGRSTNVDSGNVTQTLLTYMGHVVSPTFDSALLVNTGLSLGMSGAPVVSLSGDVLGIVSRTPNLGGIWDTNVVCVPSRIIRPALAVAVDNLRKAYHAQPTTRNSTDVSRRLVPALDPTRLCRTRGAPHADCRSAVLDRGTTKGKASPICRGQPRLFGFMDRRPDAIRRSTLRSFYAYRTFAPTLG